MAFAATTEWDVRTTGSDSNGGGFDTASTGTDRSQQNAAYIAFTDLVIDGTTNTNCTSAAHPFDATSVGNIINITGGTGFTVQRVRVVSVASAVATCDKSLGTLSSTGGTGNLGGSLLTIGQAGTIAITGNTVHVKTGTYTVTTGATLTVGNGNIALIGYGSAHNDGGTAPLMTTSTNSITLLTLPGGFITTNVAFISNINFSSTAGTPGIGIAGGSGGPGLVLRNSKISGCSKGIDSAGNFPAAVIESCEITGCTTWGVLVTSGQSISITDSYIHGNGGAGTGITTGGLSLAAVKVIELERSIITANAGVNVLFPSGSTVVMTLVRGCTIAGATGSGGSTVGSGSGICFNQGSALPYVSFRNNIFYGNAGWGTFSTNGSGFSYQGNGSNAYGANTQGARGTTGTGNALAAGTGDVTLSSDPFTNSGTGDYSLNVTAGGGAACKGTGYPGAFPGALTTGSISIGAADNAATSGGSGSGGSFTFAA